MNMLDQIKDDMAELASRYGHDSKVVHQGVETYLADSHGFVYGFNAPLITCKDCKYGKAIARIGCIMFSHVDPRLQPKDPDGFCAWAERRDGE